MSQWLFKGLQTGIKTTRYPAQRETTSGVTPGLPLGGPCTGNQAQLLTELCPTAAFSRNGHDLSVDYRRCIHCFRCHRGGVTANWQSGFEWAAMAGNNNGRVLNELRTALVNHAGNRQRLLRTASG